MPEKTVTTRTIRAEMFGVLVDVDLTTTFDVEKMVCTESVSWTPPVMDAQFIGGEWHLAIWQPELKPLPACDRERREMELAGWLTPERNGK